MIEISTLEQFRDIVTSIKNRTPLMEDYLNFVNGLPHGCSCNRGSRLNHAKRLYLTISSSLSEEHQSEIKSITKSEKVTIKLENQNINEF